MLEFIVLGHIPGTNIYIPFSFIAPLIGVIAAITLYYYYFTPVRDTKKRAKSLAEISL
jgi:hypothetical protein